MRKMNVFGEAKKENLLTIPYFGASWLFSLLTRDEPPLLLILFNFGTDILVKSDPIRETENIKW